ELDQPEHRHTDDGRCNGGNGGDTHDDEDTRMDGKIVQTPNGHARATRGSRVRVKIHHKL
ncbi:MAG TPA: hypothetical protein VL154_19485, partial [Acetobacteraceae bacterium]|nr:hypothetical protein [Acetobacteraceae bacterium]